MPGTRTCAIYYYRFIRARGSRCSCQGGRYNPICEASNFSAKPGFFVENLPVFVGIVQESTNGQVIPKCIQC